MVRLRIAELVEAEGWNAHEFAKNAALPVTTAYRLLGKTKRGKSKKPGPPRQLSTDTIDKVCTALGVRPGDLFDYQREEEEGALDGPHAYHSLAVLAPA